MIRGKTIAIALMMAAFLALYGCASGQTNASAPAVEESEPEQETIDLEALNTQIVDGYWQIDSATVDSQVITQATILDAKKQGTLYYGKFNDDGTFVMYNHSYGQDKVLWPGTWVIDDDGVFTMTLENGIPFTTDTISDTLSLKIPSNIQTGNRAWQLTLSKLTNDEIQAEIAAANEISPTITVGQPVETDEFSFEVTSAGFVNEFYPPDTSGYYSYYEASAGKQFYLVRGTFKNLGSTTANLRYATDAKLSFNGGQYELEPEIAGCRSDADDFYDYSVGPLDSIEFFIFTEVSDELAASTESAELYWRFASPMDVYYNDSVCAHSYGIVL